MTRNTYEPCPRCRANGRDSRGDNLVHFADGSRHCFSCGYHKPGNVIHHHAFVKPQDEYKSLLPADFSREIPAKALKWLFQFGVPYETWKEIIGYSAKEERLVFRVEYNGTLAFSIGRYFGEENRRKWYVWGESHKHCHVVGEDSTKVVLVEDIVSAYKVGQVAQAIPLFGVKIHNPHYYYLINSTQDVVLWLDKDQEQSVKAKALNLETIINRPVKVVVTEQDPKLLPKEIIYEKVFS